MAAENELESLVVKLTGDGSEYSKMLKQSVEETQEATSMVTGFIGRIEGFAAGAASALASLGITATLKEALGNFQEAETIGLRLDAVLESNGRNAEQLKKQYGDVAAALEKTTTMEDDATLALFAKAEAFDVTGAAAEKAVKDSIYLAAATGQSAEGLMRITAALAKGDVEMAQRFSRMIPQLKGVKNEMEFVAKAEKLIATGMKTAEAEMRSSAGVLKVLHRDWGNLLELFGEVVAKAILPVVQGLTDLVNWMKTWDQQTIVTVTAVAGLVAGFLALGPALGVLGTVAGLVLNPVVLGIVAAGVAAASWVESLGGVEEAWKLIKSTASDVYRYVSGVYDDLVRELKPVTDAIKSLWDAVAEKASQAWKWVKEKGGEAWEWVKEKATAAGGAMLDAWNDATGNSLSTWDQVRDKVQEVFLFAEYAVRNFGQVWEYAWTAMQLGAVTALNAVVHGLELSWAWLKLVNAKTLNAMVYGHEVAWASMKLAAVEALVDIVKFVEDVMGGAEIIAALVVFRTNWIMLFKGAHQYFLDFVMKTLNTAAFLAVQLPKVLAGGVVEMNKMPGKLNDSFELDFQNTRKSGIDRLKEYHKQLQKELESVKAGGGKGIPFLKQYQEELEKGLKEIRAGGGGVEEFKKLQADLEKKLASQGGKLGEDFAKFVKVWKQEAAWDDFWAELFPEDKVAEAEVKGEQAGKKVAAKFDKGVGKFDAAARNSVEALGRVQEYLDRMKEKPEDKKGKKSESMARFDASAKGSPEALQRQDAQTELLKKLVALNERIANKESIDVAPMNLTA